MKTFAVDEKSVSGYIVRRLPLRLLVAQAFLSSITNSSVMSLNPKYCVHKCQRGLPQYHVCGSSHTHYSKILRSRSPRAQSFSDVRGEKRASEAIKSYSRSSRNGEDGHIGIDCLSFGKNEPWSSIGLRTFKRCCGSTHRENTRHRPESCSSHR
jgi:hypothetical protein